MVLCCGLVEKVFIGGTWRENPYESNSWFSNVSHFTIILEKESHGFVEVEAEMHVKVSSLFGLVYEPAKFHWR